MEGNLHQSRLLVYPIIYRVLYIPGISPDFFHQQYVDPSWRYWPSLQGSNWSGKDHSIVSKRFPLWSSAAVFWKTAVVVDLLVISKCCWKWLEMWNWRDFLAKMDHMVKCLLISCQTSFRYARTTDCEVTSANFTNFHCKGFWRKILQIWSELRWVIFVG